MSTDDLDEISTDVDDAATIVEELQHEPGVDASEQLEELHRTLEDAADRIDELENDDD